jgi:opacity protein-like surface antigen
MSLRSLALAALLAVGCAYPACAESTQWFGYEIGSGIPTKDFHEEARPGLDLGGSYTFMANRYFGVGAAIHHYSWVTTDAVNVMAESWFGTGSRIRMSDWQYTAHGVFAVPLAWPIQPFLRAGGGFYNPLARLDSPLGTASVADSHLGYNVGTGANVMVNERLGLGLSGEYHQYKADHYRTEFYRVGAQLLWRLPDFGVNP